MSGEVLLVTGGAGFIGSHVVEGLLDAYPEALVVSVDSYFTDARRITCSPGVRRIEHEIRRTA